MHPFDHHFMQTLPVPLAALISQAADITDVASDTASLSTSLIDHTSLSDGDQPMTGGETADDIKSLCQVASNPGAQTAAVCVYPNQIPAAKAALGDGPVQLAVVNNFPHGDQTSEQAMASAQDAISAGCSEIDTVIDYEAFLKGDQAQAREKLVAVADICRQNGIKLKTILKASIYPDYDSLYQAATLACETGADFVKSCTGKMAKTGYTRDQADASTLWTGAVIMQAVADYNKAHNTKIGVKISGGVKTVLDCQKYRFLVETILGPDFFTPSLFRFGASSLLTNLSGDTITTSGY